ncbi:MAG: hypothetical protein RL619_395 [Bacteroidota bacterium]|jgi:hypothetical protein
MKKYKNLHGDSGILSYEYDDYSITIQFKTKIYIYNISKIGSYHLQNMKSLADKGYGLNEYINRNQDVKKGYS